MIVHSGPGVHEHGDLRHGPIIRTEAAGTLSIEGGCGADDLRAAIEAIRKLLLFCKGVRALGVA